MDNLKAAREKQLVMYKGAPIRLSANFSTETLQSGDRGMNIQGDERHKRVSTVTPPSKAII